MKENTNKASRTPNAAPATTSSTKWRPSKTLEIDVVADHKNTRNTTSSSGSPRMKSQIKLVPRSMEADERARKEARKRTREEWPEGKDVMRSELDTEKSAKEGSKEDWEKARRGKLKSGHVSGMPSGVSKSSQHGDSVTVGRRGQRTQRKKGLEWGYTTRADVDQ